MIRWVWPVATIFLAVATPVLATQPAQCDGAALPAELAGWNEPIAGTELLPGRALRVALAPVSHLLFAVSPERPAAAASRGIVLYIRIEAPGVYRVALADNMWIDMVRDEAFVPSAAHGHGPACSTIRKIVDFRLEPGMHVLQLSNATAVATTVMVVGPTGERPTS